IPTCVWNIPSSARSPAPCKKRTTGHFCFFDQFSGTYTSYLYVVPCTTTDRSRKPVSGFLASAETPTSSNAKAKKVEKRQRFRIFVSRREMYHELRERIAIVKTLKHANFVVCFYARTSRSRNRRPRPANDSRWPPYCLCHSG